MSPLTATVLFLNLIKTPTSEFVKSGPFHGKSLGEIPLYYVGNLGPPRNFSSPQEYACLGIFH